MSVYYEQLYSPCDETVKCNNYLVTVTNMSYT